MPAQYSLNQSKQSFSDENEALALPNIITSHMAWYNKFCTACSMRGYQSYVSETY